MSVLRAVVDKGSATPTRASARRGRGMLAALAGLVASVFLTRSVLAIINPNFTPVHLVEKSDLILSGSLNRTRDPNSLRLEVRETLKGRAAGVQTVSIAAFKDDEIEFLRKLLAHNADSPILIFAGTFEKEKRAFVHISGNWLSGRSRAEGSWELLQFDKRMSGTFAGGTDMLIPMSRYIVRDPDADVPVAVGAAWLEAASVARHDGKVTGMSAVELKRRGGLHLFVASETGDRIFGPSVGKDGEDVLVEATSEFKLDSRSIRFTWVDMDRNGTADLVSFDGRAVSIRLVGPGGEFSAADPRGVLRLRRCLGLAPLGVGADGAPGVLVSTAGLPLLLEWSHARGWQKTEFPSGEAVNESAGETSACAVADLDGDGFPDVLQPRDSWGILWKGKPRGFETPRRSAVCASGGGAKAALGDFDGDGSLDIFLCNSQGHGLWENDGKAGFRDVTAGAGSLSYKVPVGLSGCFAADLDHDGRTGLGSVHPEAGFMYHFNRGYRCLADEGDLRLNQVDEALRVRSLGVQACAVGDFNADGADDLAVAFAGGEIYCHYNDLLETVGVSVRLPKGMTGPVTVSSWQGDEFPVCTGTWSVSGHAPARFFSLRDRGECVLRWCFPGGDIVERELTVIEEPPLVVLTRRGDQ